MAKFSAHHKKDGVLFFSISPGLVDDGRFANGTAPYPPVYALNIEQGSLETCCE